MYINDDDNLNSINILDIMKKPKKKNSSIIQKIEESKFKPKYYVYTDGACINNGTQMKII